MRKIFISSARSTFIVTGTRMYMRLGCSSPVPQHTCYWKWLPKVRRGPCLSCSRYLKMFTKNNCQRSCKHTYVLILSYSFFQPQSLPFNFSESSTALVGKIFVVLCEDVFLPTAALEKVYYCDKMTKPYWWHRIGGFGDSLHELGSINFDWGMNLHQQVKLDHGHG